MASFLTDDSNRSAVSDIVGNHNFASAYPYLKYSSVTQNEHPVGVILVGRSVEYRFITADGIQRNLASVATFAAPFSGNVWLALGCTILFLSVCVTAVSSRSFSHTLPRSIIDVAASLVEKVVVNAQVSHAGSIMLSCWILVAIVVSTCYRSMMKSNYLIEPKYGTRWNSFREIENFTFIYTESINEESVDAFLKQAFRDWKEGLNVCKTNASSFDHKCVLGHEHLFWQAYCSMVPESVDERNGCAGFHLMPFVKFFCLLQHCPDDRVFKEWLRRRASLLQNMASHSRVRPFSRIRGVIREELLQPHTPFVSPAEMFDADWKTFEEESKALLVRFAHSEYFENFGSMFGYQLTSGFNEYVGNAVPLRGEMLMKSGIFWLWKKREKLRQDFNSRKASNGKTFVDLSFRNSDLHLTFGVYLIGVFIALLLVGAEYFRGTGYFK